MLKITIDQMYGYLADFFESCTWSTGALTEAGNSLIERIAFEQRPETVSEVRKNKTYDSGRAVEALLDVLNTLVNSHNVAHCLNFAPLLPLIPDFDQEKTDYILYILACTGDPQYEALIRRETARFPELNPEEYLSELRGRAGGRQD